MRVEYLDDYFRVYVEPGSPESAQVRELPTRRWDPTNACWEVDAVRENVETLAAWGWLPDDFDEVPGDFLSAVCISRERNALILKSPPSYAQKCKGLPDRRFWKPERDAWVVQASGRNLEYLVNVFPDADWTPDAKELLDKAVGLKEEAKALAERKAGDTAPSTGGYMFNEVYPPYDHQLTAFGMARDAHAFAWLMEMGCVDSETEYLSPDGWQKIGGYSGGMVGQYDPETESVEFVEPLEYVKLPCREMIHFTSAWGVDQMLSPEHRVLLRNSDGRFSVTRADQLEQEISTDRNAMREWRFPTTFRTEGPGLPLTLEEVRVQVAANADGYYPPRARKTVAHIRVKKARKIARLRGLLIAAGIEFRERSVAPEGFRAFTFRPPMPKGFGVDWWGASDEQRQTVADEVAYWDGSLRKVGGVALYTRSEADADFVQFCFSSTGRCASLTRYGADYVVHASKGRDLKQLSGPHNVRRVTGHDGFKYCFQVPSTFLLFRRNGCIFPSGNTGKTRVDVDETVDLHRRGHLDSTLVICPNSIKDPWAEEARKMVPPWAKVDLRVWDASLGKKAKEELLAWVNRTPPKGDPTVYIFIMNVEAYSHKSGSSVGESFVAHHNAVKVSIDESSRIKNPSAKRTKAIIALGRMPSVKFRRIMSGTPVPQGPLDYFAQFMFLDPNILGYSSFYSFRNHFAEMGGWKGKEVTGYRNLDELQRMVDPFSYRVLRRDCMDLPPKVYEKRYVDLSKDQERLYRQMADKMVADLGGRKVTATIVLTQMLRLQQIIGGFLPPESPPDMGWEELERWKRENPQEATPIPGDNPKVEALLELVEDAPGKMIVWARFRSELDIISRALKKAYGPGSVADFHGGVSNENRTAGRLAFQDPQSKVRFFVGQTETGGLGITLTEAEVVVYFSNSFSLESRLQSEDRAHRAGTRHTVTYVDLVARATLDAKLLDALRGKKNLADVITGDDISKWI